MASLEKAYDDLALFETGTAAFDLFSIESILSDLRKQFLAHGPIDQELAERLQAAKIHRCKISIQPRLEELEKTEVDMGSVGSIDRVAENIRELAKVAEIDISQELDQQINGHLLRINRASAETRLCRLEAMGNDENGDDRPSEFTVSQCVENIRQQYKLAGEEVGADGKLPEPLESRIVAAERKALSPRP